MTADNKYNSFGLQKTFWLNGLYNCKPFDKDSRKKIIISLSHYEQICLMRLLFEIYFSHLWAA